MHALLSSELGRTELLSGNEAIVRGALEAGVGLVTGYPGTPASEIGDGFAELHAERGIHFEYSVNEKVALELAFGASLTGVRTLASMKHLGLTYGADPLSTMPYIGVVGGMVIVSAADPGCLTSPNEQDQRHLGRMLGLPTLDPATPEEARRMAAWAFELSEACELPVLLRTTSRVCHTRAPVQLGPLREPRTRGRFAKNPQRFLPTPANARRLRTELATRLDKACALLTASPFNRTPEGTERVARGIVAAGAPRNAVAAALERLGVAVPVLELGTLHPLPHELLVPFLGRCDELLVVEELSPYVEDALLAIAHHYRLGVRLRGKRGGEIPWPFELDLDQVEQSVRRFLGLEARPCDADDGAHPDRLPAAALRADRLVPERGAVLCPGCLHRNVFFAASSVFGAGATYVNDIGCYTLGAGEPYQAGDVLLAMGSSVPIASGIARSTGQRVVAFLGDSTFFHSGIPGLVNAIEHRDDLVVVVLDNHVTAMTGFQQNLASPGGSQAGRIPAVARALGVPHVAVVDAADVEATVRALDEARRAGGVAVVVAEGPCAQWSSRVDGRSAGSPPRLDPSLCHVCGMAEAGLHCGLTPSRAVQQRRAVQRHAPLHVPRTSPCSVECPIGICVPAYVGAIAAGEYERAFAAVERRAALPSVCSHICHRPCEGSCVLGEGGEAPIAINALKRYLTDRVRRRPARRSPQGPPVAIVGAGPAGLAAARELTRRGFAPTLFDARERPGGMLEYAVPAYRLPREVLRADIEAVLASGAMFEGGRALGLDLSLDGLRHGHQAVLLALGAQKGARPEIPGVRLPGVDEALLFLQTPPNCAGEAVLVLGGGDVAVDVARTALRCGATRVTVAFPEPREEMRAGAGAVALAAAEGVQLLAGRAALRLDPGADGRVSGAQLCEARGWRRAGRDVSFEPGPEAERVSATRVICAAGQRGAFSGLGLPDGVVGPDRWLAADAYGRTAVPWLFAAGDAVTGPETVTLAMAAGVRAAWAIDGFLSGGKRPVEPCGAPLPRARGGAGPVHRAPEEGPAFTEGQAVAEASRCRLCGLCSNCNACVELLACPALGRAGGRPEILSELCVSCGACVAVCPNHAIETGAAA